MKAACAQKRGIASELIRDFALANRIIAELKDDGDYGGHVMIVRDAAGRDAFTIPF